MTKFVVLLFVFLAPGSLVHAQGTEPADKTGASPSTVATEEEVSQLRSEVAAQRKTIEELKGMVQQLAEGKLQSAQTVPANAQGQAGNGARLMNAALVSAPQPPEIAQAAKPADKATEKKPAEKKADVPVVAGWNGEHLSSRAPTASFKCSRTGTFSLITAPTRGTELPRTRFSSRARFGFQGTFGTHYDYAVLIDSAASNGISLRDLYVNIKPNPAFLFQVGQYKEPFAQELLTSAPNLDFVEWSLASLLYPSAATAYRSPGATPDRRLYLACQAVNKGGGTREVSRGVANFWL